MKYRFELHVGSPITAVVPSIFDRKVIDFVGKNDLIEYEIPDGYRPDNLAYQLYESPFADWTFFVINQMTINDWPLSNRQFNLLMETMYGVDGQFGVDHYKHDQTGRWENKVIPSSINIKGGGKYNHWVRRDIIGSMISFSNVTIPAHKLLVNDADALVTEDGDAILIHESTSVVTKNPYIVLNSDEVSIRDHEYELNESKKTILVIPPKLMPEFINRYVRAAIVS